MDTRTTGGWGRGMHAAGRGAHCSGKKVLKPSTRSRCWWNSDATPAITSVTDSLRGAAGAGSQVSTTRVLGRRTRPFHLYLFLTASRVGLPKITVPAAASAAVVPGVGRRVGVLKSQADAVHSAGPSTPSAGRRTRGGGSGRDCKAQLVADSWECCGEGQRCDRGAVGCVCVSGTVDGCGGVHVRDCMHMHTAEP